MSIRGITAVSAVALAMVAAVAGCHSSASGKTSARVSALATSTAVKTDEAAAAKILKACVSGSAHIADMKPCLEKQVPAPARTALGKCLATAALRGPTYFKHTGAQACVAIAIRA